MGFSNQLPYFKISRLPTQLPLSGAFTGKNYTRVAKKSQCVEPYSRRNEPRPGVLAAIFLFVSVLESQNSF